MMSKNSISPREERILKSVGSQIKLARLRRKYSAEMVAERAGISRTTLWNLEKGKVSTSILTLMKVLSVLGLEQDLLKIAEDDILGRKIQDAKLTIGQRSPKR